MFYGLENYVLRYKSVYYEVIADYGNVFSIQYSVFFAVVTIRYIDSILYIIIYIIIYNIKELITSYNHKMSNYREKN